MSIILGVVSVTIFSLMLTIGVEKSLADLKSFLKDPALLARALFAVLFLVPAFILLLLTVFKLPIEIATAYALLAACPGAPLITKRSHMVMADEDYASSLQITLALLAIVVTPALLTVFYTFFDLSTERVSPLSVLEQISVVTLLPVVLGIALQVVTPKWCDALRAPLRKFANVMFILMVAVLLIAIIAAPELRIQLLIGWRALAFAVLVAVGGIVIGHLLGGPQLGRRSALAVACIARNLGLAIFIAGISDIKADIIPTLLVFALVGVLVQLTYSRLLKSE
ncbi:MAG: bile acid:sodium symporter family protein [Hyphomicrobiales bacterium]